MKIQMIGYSCRLLDENIEFRQISNFKSPDLFDVCVLDLSDFHFWHNDERSDSTISSADELTNFYNSCVSAKKCKFLILLPGNINFTYGSFNYSQCYSESLRTNTGVIEHIIKKIFNFPNEKSFGIKFEENYVEYNEDKFDASFFFESASCCTNIVNSYKTNKIIGKSIPNLGHFTFAQINDVIALNNYLKMIGFIETTSNCPDWVHEVRILDDIDLLEKEKVVQVNIEELNKEFANIKLRLDENAYYKKVLYTQNDELVEVVFKILENIFSVDLSNFVDKKEEDFNFKIDDFEIVGEIKGVSSNLKNIHISQTENHRQEYIDRNYKNNDFDDSKIIPFLIINHQLNKKIEDREPVNNKQKEYAKLHGVNVLDTWTLLKYFEYFKSGHKTNSEIATIFFKSGVGKIID